MVPIDVIVEKSDYLFAIKRNHFGRYIIPLSQVHSAMPYMNRGDARIHYGLAVLSAKIPWVALT